MVNISKYFLILEELKLSQLNDEKITNKADINYNLELLRKYIKLEPNKLLEKLCNELNIQYPTTEINTSLDDTTNIYVFYLEFVLLELKKNVNFDSDLKEDLISTKHINICTEAVQVLSIFAIRKLLHQSICKLGVFSKLLDSGASNYELLQLHIEFFAEMLKIKQFHTANAMETVMRDYMAGIYTLYLAHHTQEFILDKNSLKHLQDHLDFIWLQLSKLEYFRNLMLLKGIPQLAMPLQKQLHQELLQKLATNDGFTTLVATLQIAQQKNENEKQTFELIAKIVAFRGHTKRFQVVMIKQIWRFLKLCLLNDAMLASMGAGLLSLNKLYELSEQNQKLIAGLIFDEVKVLIEPSELLTGLILMEHKALSFLVSFLFHLFCTSAVECLKSELLIDYLPMLLQLYYGMPVGFQQKQQLGSCITRCLHNRSDQQLTDIIKALYHNADDDKWKQLHSRVILIPNQEQTDLTLKISSTDYKPDLSISLALPELLMCSTYYVLTYRIFMIILNLLMEQLEKTTDEHSLDLLQSEDELMEFLNTKYPIKVEILLTLNTLISYEPLKTQLSEHSKEFLEFLQQTIEKRLVLNKSATRSNQEELDQTLLILITLTQEILASSAILAEYRHFVSKLQKLRKCTPNQLVQQRISSLVALLSDTSQVHKTADPTPFNTARALLESKESHLQVYGIQMVLDLLRRKDMHTISNGHVILALALTTLQDRESYTFLNTVRLFVALVGIMEAEVLELLADEYLSEHALVDFRLIVGEALLKVSQELGPLCYKYKDVLLNCFMNGCRSHLNEFRMSSFANLAQLCRTLSYEVHKYFQELLHLIDCELTSSNYLPSKRAAVMVLSELLAGMPNLIDFGEMLLPIYRLLKTIESSENCDDKMRLHAAKGLSQLSEKCKDMLFPQQTFEKEIKIFDIKNNPKGSSLKQHILEIN